MRNRLKTLFGSQAGVSSDTLELYKPMKLIIGLGNPGDKYTTTRHNIGFLVIDELVNQYDGTDFVFNKKFSAMVSTGMIGKQQILYAKPQTFMNKSGISVRALASFYDIDSEDILVIHDDIDHAFGAIKLKFRGSHGGHNGLRDIIEKIGGQKFRRLKLGVGRPAQKHMVSDYVLGTMKPDELDHWAKEVGVIFEEVEKWLRNVG